MNRFLRLALLLATAEEILTVSVDDKSISSQFQDKEGSLGSTPNVRVVYVEPTRGYNRKGSSFYSKNFQNSTDKDVFDEDSLSGDSLIQDSLKDNRKRNWHLIFKTIKPVSREPQPLGPLKFVSPDFFMASRTEKPHIEKPLTASVSGFWDTTSGVMKNEPDQIQDGGLVLNQLTSD